MNASENCLHIIRDCEGFSPTPYRCPAGVWTIGYGSTRYPDGRAVGPDDDAISMDTADDIMRATLATYEDAVNRYVQVDITQDQFDALVDFAYNAGARNLKDSTLLRKLNAGDFEGAAEEFGRWVNGGGRVLPGLVKRRELERKLFVGEA